MKKARKKPKRQPKHETLVNLPSNLRFYVLTSAIILSIAIACWLRLHIPSDQLFYIRTQQVFGFVALMYWYVALVLSPLSKIFGKRGTMGYLLFSRRAIGVSAAYFAFMHAAVAFWGQMGGSKGLQFLPERFQWSLAFGLFGLIVLALMAVTSFDKVVKYMTFRRWKWLHRVGYIAGILVLLHVWMIATHVGYFAVQWSLAVMLIVLSWLEAFRVSLALGKKYKSLKGKEEAVIFLIWGLCLLAIFSTPRLVKNYHQERHGANHGAEHQHE